MPDLHHQKSPGHRRNFYILPNLFTTGTLFGGFYGIIAATQGHFGLAAWAIVFAMITDMLDGRVARLTLTQSEFGVQYDSLADLVAFGLSPALVSYFYSLQYLADYNSIIGKLGWLATFFYAAATALRLARFNVASESDAPESHKNNFTGLPSPAGAGLVIGFIWFSSDFDIQGITVALPVLFFTIAAGALMVSNIEFFSPKRLSLNERVPFLYLLVILVAVIVALIDPPRVMFAVFLIYALSGPVLYLYQFKKRRQNNE